MTRIVLAALALAVTAAPAFGHHSETAEFDANKPVKVTGTLVRVEWLNPHVWFYVDVKDDKGNVLEVDASLQANTKDTAYTSSKVNCCRESQSSSFHHFLFSLFFRSFSLSILFKFIGRENFRFFRGLYLHQRVASRGSRYAGRAPCGKGRSTHGYARVPLVIFTSPAEISAGFFASTLNQQAHSVQGLCFRVQT